MRVRKKLIAAVCAAPVAVALMATPALAGSITSVSIQAKGTKKHKINIVGGGSYVTFDVRKGPLGASYSVDDAKVTAKKIKGKVPGFGRINAKFTVKKRTKQAKRKGCTGKPAKIRKGVWKGKIKFKESYTKLNKKKARGMVVLPGTLYCPPPGGGGDGTFTALHADKFTGNRDFWLSVSQFGNRKPEFSASTTETTPKGVSIYRGSTVRGPKSGFVHDVGAETATVTPPGPAFKGSASLSGASWTGNLKVKFLGLGAVDFVSGFSASLSAF